jgi:predicted Holliday junction resolvase-like endonuclease
MNTEEIIRQLKDSNLYAECPSCDGEFKLSEAILFDGTKPFPSEVLKIQQALEEELKKRGEELKKTKKHATITTQKTTIAINIGQELEKISPHFKDFKWSLPDCRFLGNPVDFISFTGLSNNKIKAIDFVEIKTGHSRLGDSQKCVKDAIEDKKVSYKEFI